jgi:hypothetical protein
LRELEQLRGGPLFAPDVPGAFAGVTGPDE